MSTIRFLLATETDNWSSFGTTLRVKLSAVYLTDQDEVRNPSFTGYSDDRHGHLDGFTIGASYAADLGWYGWSADFRDAYRVELRRAESMVKLLRKIERRLETDRAKYGEPTDFPVYAARVADVAGARLDTQTFGLPAPSGERIWASSGERYRWCGVDALRYRLTDLVRELTPA